MIPLENQGGIVVQVSLVPTNERVLVELGDNYENIHLPNKVYEAMTNGVVVRMDTDLLEDWGDLLGKRIYWQEDNARAPIIKDRKKYTFVHIDDIEGYENGE